MTHLRDRLKLTAYASGSGYLTLVWLTKKDEGTGRAVTKQDALRYLRSREGDHLRALDFRVFQLDNHWVLARHVERLDAATLRTQDRSLGNRDLPHDYRYSIDHSRITWIADANLTLKFQHAVDGPWYPVVNQSIRMAIVNFLRHEEAMKPGGFT